MGVIITSLSWISGNSVAIAFPIPPARLHLARTLVLVLYNNILIPLIHATLAAKPNKTECPPRSCCFGLVACFCLFFGSQVGQEFGCFFG